MLRSDRLFDYELMGLFVYRTSERHSNGERNCPILNMATEYGFNYTVMAKPVA